MTADEFRRMALALDGATENSHMNHPDFRAGGKIFATLGYPDHDWGMVKLPPEQQNELVQREAGAFSPAKGAWGRQGSTQVRLSAADASAVQGALRSAWELARRRPRRKGP